MAKPNRFKDPGDLSRFIVQHANDCIISLNHKGSVLSCNLKAETLFGYALNDIKGRPISSIIPDLSFPDVAISERSGLAEVKGLHKDGTQFPLELSLASYLLANKTFYILVARDVSERQERDEFISEALKMAKSPTRKEFLDSLVRLMQSWSGCSCVGVRILNEEGSMPFESFVGFSKEFWEWENWLSIKSDSCICTRIITGATESQDAAITTQEGSFRTDNMSNFLCSLSAMEKTRFRGNCPKFGYLSIMFSPIQYRGKVYGGIHVTDEREGMLPPKKVQFIESIATHIGQAIFRLTVEEALRKSELRYRNLFEESPAAVLEADVSVARQYIEEWRNSGVCDFNRYFSDHCADAGRCASGIKIIEVNKAMLYLYEAATAEQLVDFIQTTRGCEAFLGQLAGLDQQSYDAVTVCTVKGNLKHVILKLSWPADGERNWSRVIVTINDVTERKRAMEAMERFNDELVEKVKERTTELEQARQAAERLSLLDGLTGIANRRKFEDLLDFEWRRGIRSLRPLSLIMLDIDFFKLYNDHYGHLFGDDALRRIAQSLFLTLQRPADLAARYGGEEFGCILPDTDAEGALSIATFLQDGINSLRIPHEHSSISDFITVSIGIATLVPAHGSPHHEIVKLADDRLYAAKRKGRNRIEAAGPPDGLQ